MNGGRGSPQMNHEGGEIARAGNGNERMAGAAHYKKASDAPTIEVQTDQTKLIGLTVDELERYKTNPFWKNIRCTFFTAFWLAWCALFAVAVFIVVLSPKCSSMSGGKWHEQAVIYQIFTPTFHDSDGDGVGDLRGIEEKLNELKKIGITAIWPVPIAKTDKNEFMPERVEELLEVDPRFGGIDDLKALVMAVHRAGMRFVMDLPLTARRDSSWASRLNYGVMTDEMNGDSSPNGAYLVNVSNDKVINRLVEAARAFTGLGVDGFRLSDYGLAKNVVAGKLKPIQILANRIRLISPELVVFVDPPLELSPSPAAPNSTVVPVNYRVANLTEGVGSRGEWIIDRLERNVHDASRFLDERMGAPYRPMWRRGDLNSPRLDQQIEADPELKDADPTILSALLTLTQLFLPGPTVVYYGDELSLASAPATYQHKPYPRQRALMSWDTNSVNNGFSSFDGTLFFAGAEQANQSSQSNRDGSVRQGTSFEKQYADGDSALHAFKYLAKLRASDEAAFRSLRFLHGTTALHIYTRYANANTTEAVYVLAVYWPQPKNDERAYLLNLTSKLVLERSLTKAEVKLVFPVYKGGIKAGRSLNLEDLAKETLAIQPLQAVLFRFV